MIERFHMRYKHFSKIERLELSILLKKGHSLRDIGRALRKDPASVSREVRHNSVNGEYDPHKAQHKAYVKRKYSKYQGMKVNEHQEIRDYIEEKIRLDWSPEAVAGRLKIDSEGRLSIHQPHLKISLYCLWPASLSVSKISES